MNDNRIFSRYAMQLAGKLMSADMSCCVEVVIRDMSVDGALVISSAPVHFPERGYLWQAQTRTLFECHVQWRKNDRLFGVRFTDAAGRAQRRAIIAACSAASMGRGAVSASVRQGRLNPRLISVARTGPRQMCGDVYAAR
jgi:hypothetical protein